MEDFLFFNPTKIVFGSEAELKIVPHIKEFAPKKILILYGMGFVKSSGLFDRVVRRLIKNELFFTEFGGVKPNPTLSHTKEAIEWARKNGVDAILAIGGGSVIDEAKAIAAGYYYDGDVWDFYEKKAVPVRALPIFTILTLSATGSEANPATVLTNESEQKKYAFAHELLFPKLSAINPALTTTLSDRQTATAVADAISHILEGYLTKQNEFRLNDRLSEALLKTIVKDSERMLQNPKDYSARASFAWSATLALNGMLSSGLEDYSFPNHLIEHSLSALYDIPHGEGLAIVMPAWLGWRRQKEPKRVDRFTKKIFKKSGEEGVAAFEAWLKSIGLPTRLEDVSIDTGEIPKITQNILLAASRSKLYAEYDKKTIEDILKRALR